MTTPTPLGPIVIGNKQASGLPRTWKPPCPWGDDHSALNVLERVNGCDESPEWQGALDALGQDERKALVRQGKQVIGAVKRPDGGADMLALLISLGYRLDLARDAEGATALHWASRNGHADSAQLLLDAKCDVNALDTLGWTPLMAATFSNSPEVVRLLLAHGADPRFESTDYFDTALSNAREVGSTKCVALLSAALNPDDKLNEAAKSGDEVRLAAALKEGATLKGARMRLAATQTHHRERCTPLHWACANGHAACVKRLLEVRAAVDETDARDCWTPLMAAVTEWEVDVVKLLLDAAADPLRTTRAGLTALASIPEGSTNPCVALLTLAMEEATSNPNRDGGNDASFSTTTSNGHTAGTAMVVVDAADLGMSVGIPPRAASRLARAVRRMSAVLSWSPRANMRSGRSDSAVISLS